MSDAIAPVRLPRWRAARAGIINIFEYGDQVFEFGDGRLLLRGPNGSGKSKAMELLFPFLFEGDMSPAKLDPFGKNARKMKWNLLMDGKYAHRIGYSWLELRHDDPRARPEYATFGVCLDAHKEWDEVKARFFYVPDRRVGLDFQLIGEREQPLRRDELAELVAGLGGETFTQPGPYRERLNQVVFGYPSVKRLIQQIRLQRTLRRPQLSDSLDEKMLNELLSDALPEIDGDLLEHSSKRLDQIADSRTRLETLQRNEKAVADFAVTYAAYARAELRERGARFRAAADELCDARTAEEAATRQHEQALAALSEAEAAIAAVRGELEELRQTYETLLASPEMKAADEIARARERAEEVRAALTRHQAELTAAGDELARKQAAHDQQEMRLREAEVLLREEDERLGGLAVAAGIDAHAQLAGARDPNAPSGPVIEQLERAAQERRVAIEDVRGRRRIADDRLQVAGRLRGLCNDAREQAEEVRASRLAAEEELGAVRDRLAHRLAAWASTLEELALEPSLLDLLDAAVGESGAPEVARLADIAAPLFAEAEAIHARAEIELDRRAGEIARERSPLENERAQLEAAVDPVPQPPHARGSREDGRPGAPFWLLVDFADDLDEAGRAGLEGALEGAGVLDAWVLPDGSLLGPESDDVVLVPAALGGGETLARHLRPAGGEPSVAPDVVERLLQSIVAGASRESGLAVDLDGSYAFGPARGRHPKQRAQFVGVAARAENRARRLAELDGALAALDELDRALAGEREALAARRSRAADERRRLPSEADVRLAHDHHVRVTLEAEVARRAFETAELTAIGAEREADLTRQDVEVVAGRHRLDPSGSEQSLAAVSAHVDRYADALGALREADFERRAALQMVDQLTGDLADVVGRRDRQVREVELAETAVRSGEGRLAGLETLGEGATRALERAQELKSEIGSADRREKALTGEQTVHASRAAGFERDVAHAAGRVAAGTETLDGALTDLRVHAGAELLPLALGGRGAAPAREAALSWSCEEWSSFLDGLDRDALATRGGIEHLTNALDAGYQTLVQRIDASQLKISKDREFGLVVVRGFTHGSERPLAMLAEALAGEVAESERRLSEEDRRLFEEFVTGGLAEHLHQRIGEARETVARMNDEIARVQASSGMSIEVRWQRSEDAGPAHRRALELLQASPSRLTPREQAELQEFIRDQVRLARLDAAEQETTLAQLGKALDYRRWHCFKLSKRNAARGIEARELTRHEHDSGSGGEKAISLHLPLLAAAAGYPASGRPDALRMVMLDEAFTRIDEEGRRGIMGLIAKFDLDVMLTSPDFWGCYEDVPALSIYALAPHDERFPGVVARRFHWDGARRRAVDEPAVAEAASEQPAPPHA